VYRGPVNSLAYADSVSENLGLKDRLILSTIVEKVHSVTESLQRHLDQRRAPIDPTARPPHRPQRAPGSEPSSPQASGDMAGFREHQAVPWDSDANMWTVGSANQSRRHERRSHARWYLNK